MTVADASCEGWSPGSARCVQASLIAEDLLKHNPEVVKIIFNKFRSAISFKPTLATVLSPAVSEGLLGRL